MPTALYAPEIDAGIAESPLYASGGFTIIPDLFTGAELEELHAEALSARASAVRSVSAEFIDNEGRGGSPQRAFFTAHADMSQWRLFNTPEIMALLNRLTGLAVVPTGGGTFSYYECVGDFLALHRDVETCDLTALTCIQESEPASGDGKLLVYPEHIMEPLSTVRAAGRAAGRSVPLRFGETAFLLGGIVPHEVTPMGSGSPRVVSVMCYRVIPAGVSG